MCRAAVTGRYGALSVHEHTGGWAASRCGITRMTDLAAPALAQGRTPLHLAARHAGSDAAGALGDLLAAGGAVEAADAAGATPLLAALAENRRDAVSALLDAGARPPAHTAAVLVSYALMAYRLKCTTEPSRGRTSASFAGTACRRGVPLTHTPGLARPWHRPGAQART